MTAATQVKIPKPEVVCVPGFWEGPHVFDNLVPSLKDAGYGTHVVKLPSTGTKSPGNPTMADDIAAVRQVVEKIADGTGKDVILILHSSGCVFGSAAVKGFDRRSRAEQGNDGSVVWLVILVGGAYPEGKAPSWSSPFFDIQIGNPVPYRFFSANVETNDLPKEQHDDVVLCKDPETTLFKGLSESEAKEWVQRIQPQPVNDYLKTVEYTGWKDIPSTYLICEEDGVMPVPVQEHVAQLTGSKVERCNAGHMVALTHPEVVVKVVEDAVQQAGTSST